MIWLFFVALYAYYIFVANKLLTIHRPINRANNAAPSRTMAAESRAHLYKDIPKNLDQLKNNIWLSDAGAFPILFVVTFACGLGASRIAYCCMKNPDVRISTGRRQELIRNWE